MRIAICDDEEVWNTRLRHDTSEWASERGRSVEIVTCRDADMLRDAHNRHPFDLILLDIQMQGIDGMTLARQLRAKNDRTGIFFVTGYAEYLEQGYEVEAFRYMLKPVSREKLWEALDKFAQRALEEPKTLLLETDKTTVRVEGKDIVYVEAYKHCCEVHTMTETLSVNAGISELEKRMRALGLPVVRCHRSYLVNIAHVVQIGREYANLDKEESVPVSRSGYPLLNQAFIAYFSRRKIPSGTFHGKDWKCGG